MQKRERYIDIASGLMILWVLLNHALAPALDYQVLKHVPCLCFFMPFFFYKSGALSVQRTWRDDLKKDTYKLLRKWAIWSLIGYLVLLVMNCLIGDVSLSSMVKQPLKMLLYQGRVYHNEGLWFLFSLFIVRQVANVGKSPIQHVIIMCLAFVGAVFMNHSPLLGKFVWVSNSLSGLVYFEMGRLFHRWEANRVVVIIAACVYLICTIFGFPLVSMWNNETLQGCYILWFPVCFCGIVLLNYLSKLMMLSQSRTIHFFEYFGQNAMLYYVPHFLLSKIWIVAYWHGFPSISGWWVTSLILFSYILILPLFRNLQIKYNI